jgi:uncharacterized repeat protein (TIGR02543 family)
MYNKFTTWGAALMAALALLALSACPTEPADDGNVTCKVTFNADGGTPAPQAQNVARGGKVTEPPAMTKTGYTFGGWYKEAACTNAWNFAGDTVTSNITLYAKWTQNAVGTFTVTFNADGGTPMPAAQNIARGGTVTEPAAMSKTGYAFGGWYKEAACTTAWDFAADTVTADITLYAKWTQNAAGTFTVTFNADGGTPAPAAQNIAGGGTVTEPAAMSKTGYTFGGWYKEAACTTAWDFAADTVTADITLYAKWTQNAAGTFTVTFNADGGTPAPAAQNIADGGTVTEPAAMSKTGYTFGGWYKEAACTTAWDFAADTVTADITLYAKWTQNAAVAYVINYDVSGGDALVPAGKTVISPPETTVGTLPTPTKTGTDFAGWYTQQNGQGVRVTDATQLSALPFTADAITIYAYWVTPVASLALRYDFTGTETTITDKAGTNNGTLNGSAALGTHNGIPVLKIGAENGYVDMGAGAGAIITAQDTFTIASYVYIENAASLSGNGWFLWCLSSTDAASQTAGKYTFFRPISIREGFSLAGWGSEQNVSLGGNMSKDAWHHVLYRQNETVGEIFIDGIKVATSADTFTIKPTDLGSLTYNWIGRPCFSGDNYMKNTWFADFRIYRTAITDAEVASLSITATLRALDAADTSELTAKITEAQTILADGAAQDTVFGLETPRGQRWANRTGLQQFITDAQTLIAAGGATTTEVAALVNRFGSLSGNGYGYTMVSVPAGKFQRDATPANITEITKTYKMGAFEVTQELWQAVMGVNYSFNKGDPVNSLIPADGGSDSNSNAGIVMHYSHAIVFCNKLSILMGKTPVYSRAGGAAIDLNAYPNSLWSDWVIDANANGYRLPTEMEWMWAAMGANRTAADMVDGVNIKGYKKDFAGDPNPDAAGDDPAAYAWTATYAAGNGQVGQTWPAVTGNTAGVAGNNNPSYSQPVGGKLPNELGLYDMSGNLTELCIDKTNDSFSAALWPAGTLTDWYESTTGGRFVVMGGDYGGNYPLTVSREQWENSKNCAYGNYPHRYYGIRIVATDITE